MCTDRRASLLRTPVLLRCYKIENMTDDPLTCETALGISRTIAGHRRGAPLLPPRACLCWQNITLRNQRRTHDEVGTLRHDDVGTRLPCLQEITKTRCEQPMLGINRPLARTHRHVPISARGTRRVRRFGVSESRGQVQRETPARTKNMSSRLQHCASGRLEAATRTPPTHSCRSIVRR